MASNLQSWKGKKTFLAGSEDRERGCTSIKAKAKQWGESTGLLEQSVGSLKGRVFGPPGMQSFRWCRGLRRRMVPEILVPMSGARGRCKPIERKESLSLQHNTVVMNFSQMKQTYWLHKRSIPINGCSHKIEIYRSQTSINSSEKYISVGWKW